jgi:hypothetical protein
MQGTNQKLGHIYLHINQQIGFDSGSATSAKSYKGAVGRKNAIRGAFGSRFQNDSRCFGRWKQ